MKINDSLFNKSIVHDSGAKHVSGLAKYTDDIDEPINTLYGAIGWSKNDMQKLKIDLGTVKSVAGVISIVTHLDIPGRNDVGAVFDGDPIFPKNSRYYGQPLFVQQPQWNSQEKLY